MRTVGMKPEGEKAKPARKPARKPAAGKQQTPKPESDKQQTDEDAEE